MEGLAPKNAPEAPEAVGESKQPEATAEGLAPESTTEAPPEKKEQPPADGKLHLTAEEQKIHDDLHWLIHEGHVIEFANGVLETAKAPKNPQAKDAAKAYEDKRRKQPRKKPEAGAKPAPSLDDAVNEEASKAEARPDASQPAPDVGASSESDASDAKSDAGGQGNGQTEDSGDQGVERAGQAAEPENAPAAAAAETPVAASAAETESLPDNASGSDQPAEQTSMDESPASAADAPPASEGAESGEAKPE
jgi:hypothetical protein